MRYELTRDSGYESPRTWGNACVMVCAHQKYNLGDRQLKDAQEVREFHKDLEHRIRPAIQSPLYLYDHSGITMSTTPFSCQWDSGQVGMIYMTRKVFEEEYKSDEKLATRRLISEVEVYDMYLTNDVWCYDIFDDEDNILKSLCGIYGYDHAEQEAKSAMVELKSDLVKKGEYAI